jgi:DNA-binding PadR family transcriptional regulator
MKGFLKLVVLKEIENKDQTGYDLMSSVSNILGKKPSPGSIYPLLKELVGKGLITSKTQGRKIIYHLTMKGKIKLKELENERQTMIKTHIKISKILSCISGDLEEKEVKCQNIVFGKLSKEKNNPIIKNFELVKNVRENFMTVLLSNDYIKYEKEIREILLESNRKLKKLIAKVKKNQKKKS